VRQYWRFWWPLALTSLIAIIVRPFQNGVLSRYPGGEQEIAVFGLSLSIYMFFESPLIFIPQVSNILARSPRAHAVCLRFTVAACLALMAVCAFVAWSAPGKAVLIRLFSVRSEMASMQEPIFGYLRWQMPLILVNGLRYYYIGLLVQRRRTALVMGLNAAFLVTLVASTMVFFRLSWAPVITIAMSQVVAAFIHLGLMLYYMRRPPSGGPEPGVPSPEPEHLAPRTAEVFAFFWPMALNSFMFSFSRPILFFFLCQTPDSIPAVAAITVGFSFALIFQNVLNQFRHLFATFGDKDLPGVRRFMFTVTAAVTILMLLVVATPLGTRCIRALLGENAEDRLVEQSRIVVLILCAVPALMAWRNYYHGLALLARKTGGMGLGGVLRNAAIAAAAWALFRSDGLDYASAASLLALGFAAEAATVMFCTLWRRGAAAATAPAQAREEDGVAEVEE
jgi:hypothetical protein